MYTWYPLISNGGGGGRTKKETFELHQLQIWFTAPTDTINHTPCTWHTHTNAFKKYYGGLPRIYRVTGGHSNRIPKHIKLLFVSHSNNH